MPFDPADHLDASLDFSEDVAAAAATRATPHFPFPFDYHPLAKKPTTSTLSNTTSGFLKHLDHIDSHNTMDAPSRTTVTTNHPSAKHHGGNGRHRSGGGGGGYSPPAWRRLGNGDRSSGFWRKGGDDLLLGGGGGGGGRGGDGSRYKVRRRRASSSRPGFDYDSASDDDDEDDMYGCGDSDDDIDDILAAAIRTRLPTGSMSPEKERSPEPEYAFAPAQTAAMRYGRSAAGRGNGGVEARIKMEEPDAEDMKATLAALPPAPHQQKEGDRDRDRDPDNYIRFAVRASVQQRSEPIEALITHTRALYRTITASPASLLLSTLVALLAIAATRALFVVDQTGGGRPVPDLVKVAGIARSFEPLIYYSENGVAQVGDLQATGVAVWDLGESVRSSNLTSAPIIVRELDELSESLKTLAIELTKFFANVDGDVDGILIVMDWARRELTQVLPSNLPTTPLSSLFSNLHTLLTFLSPSPPPLSSSSSSSADPSQSSLSRLATTVFGPSNPQRTLHTLQRTFNEFLAVLEQAIADELHHSLQLFGLFEAIDHQFLNLARTVVREANAQDEAHADLLSSLWTRLLGPKASAVAKYERNRLLLLNVREKTVRNKGILVEHNHKLLALKANLEALRRKLVSPLVRSVNSSTLSVDEQIRGLEDVGGYLEGVRARQKGKLMEMLYGSGSRRGGEQGESRLLDGEGSAGIGRGGGDDGRRRLF
ncbi:unnamed protein product [Discula destructiva]